MIDAILNIVILLALLTVLVLLHELGHFITARRAGVIVHEFGIGFPPRARVLFVRGDTTYTLNWLPIGGFVRLEGEEPSPADGTEPEIEDEPLLEAEATDEVESLDPRAFVNQSLGTRLRILFAGVAVNFVLAWVIFTLIALVAEPIWNVRLAHVMPESPAAAAGLVGGEFIEKDLFVATDENGVATGEVIRSGGKYVKATTGYDLGQLIVGSEGTLAIVTEVTPFRIWYEGEDYHQDYYKNNSQQPYCQVVTSPKVAKFRKKFAKKLKQT